jgi:hypothetical protein
MYQNRNYTLRLRFGTDKKAVSGGEIYITLPTANIASVSKCSIPFGLTGKALACTISTTELKLSGYDTYDPATATHIVVLADVKSKDIAATAASLAAAAITIEVYAKAAKANKIEELPATNVFPITLDTAIIATVSVDPKLYWVR